MIHRWRNQSRRVGQNCPENKANSHRQLFFVDYMPRHLCCGEVGALYLWVRACRDKHIVPSNAACSLCHENGKYAILFGFHRGLGAGPSMCVCVCADRWTPIPSELFQSTRICAGCTCCRLKSQWRTLRIYLFVLSQSQMEPRAELKKRKAQFCTRSLLHAPRVLCFCQDST